MTVTSTRSGSHMSIKRPFSKQDLYEGFSGLMSFAFCFSSVGVIPSLSVSFTTSVGLGGPAEVFWAWIVGSVFTIISALSMAEICSNYPRAGSVYAWSAGLASEAWSPVFSYVTGWASMLGNCAGDAAFAYGFAQAVGFTITTANPDYEITPGFITGVSIGICWVWAILNCVRSDILGYFNNAGLFLQGGASIVIVIVVLSMAQQYAPAKLVFTFGEDCTQFPGTQNMSSMNYDDGLGDGNALPCSSIDTAYTIVLGITTCLFAFVGYDAAGQMSEETQNAETSAPRGILLTAISCAIFGAVYILAFLFSSQDIRQLANPLADTFANGAQSEGLGLMIVLVLMYFFAGHSSLTATSRILFALARDDGIPFSYCFVQVWGVSKVPVRTVVLTAVLDTILMFFSLFSSQALTAILGTSVVGYQLSYAIVFVERFIFRYRWKPGPFSIGILSLPFALIAAVWQISTSVVFLWPTVFPVTAATMNYTVVVASGFMFIAAVYWILFARYHFVGPYGDLVGFEAEEKPELPTESRVTNNSTVSQDAQVMKEHTMTGKEPTFRL